MANICGKAMADEAEQVFVSMLFIFHDVSTFCFLLFDQLRLTINQMLSRPLVDLRARHRLLAIERIAKLLPRHLEQVRLP